MNQLVKAAAISLFTLSSQDCCAEKPASIKIGILASLTDEWATLGDNIIKGAKLATATLNESGGLCAAMLDLVIEDTRGANSGAHAVTAYRSMRQRGIRFFIGPTGLRQVLRSLPSFKCNHR
jgi:ABC-type branched-subunit amino acid transport system substrate-binding protein